MTVKLKKKTNVCNYTSWRISADDSVKILYIKWHWYIKYWKWVFPSKLAKFGGFNFII